MRLKGGGKKKNPAKRGFQPVEDMMQSIGTDFRILTADSLFGFMVVMDVSPENSEYLGLTPGRKKMSNPITSYLLKLAVISDTSHYMQPAIRLPDGRPPFLKSSETASNLYKEAKIQQRLWIDSIIGGRIPVCPDVYAFSVDMGDSMFGGEHSTASFKSRNEPKFSYCYDFLREKSRYKYTKHSASEPGPYAIGAIAMEYIPNSRILYDILHDRDLEDMAKNEACIFAGAQVLRLFLNHSILHHDLHCGNILVNEDGMAFIIDFGMVLDITNLTAYETLLLGDIISVRDQFIADLHHKHVNKKVLCSHIFTTIREIETKMNGRFQMIALYNELIARDLHAEVVDKYFELSQSESTSMSRAYIKNQDDAIEMIYDRGLELTIRTDIHRPSDHPHLLIMPEAMPQTILMPETLPATVLMLETNKTPKTPKDAVGIRRKTNKKKKKRKKKNKTKSKKQII
jgi:serine/threonine-protein kinase RIO1